MRKVNEEFLDLEVSTQESSRPLAELHVVGRRESIIDGFGLMAIGHTTSYVVIKGEEVLSDISVSNRIDSLGISYPFYGMRRVFAARKSQRIMNRLNP